MLVIILQFGSCFWNKKGVGEEGEGVGKGTGVNILELDVVVLFDYLAWQFVQYYFHWCFKLDIGQEYFHGCIISVT